MRRPGEARAKLGQRPREGEARLRQSLGETRAIQAKLARAIFRAKPGRPAPLPFPFISSQQMPFPKKHRAEPKFVTLAVCSQKT